MSHVSISNALVFARLVRNPLRVERNHKPLTHVTKAEGNRAAWLCWPVVASLNIGYVIKTYISVPPLRRDAYDIEPGTFCH